MSAAWLLVTVSFMACQDGSSEQVIAVPGSGGEGDTGMAAVGATGVSSAAPGSFAACAADADCEGQERCVASGVCLAAGRCATSGDCEAVAQRCSASGVCLEKGSCLGALDCEIGEQCDLDSGRCVPGGCEQQSFGVEAVPPNILIVLDRSCSMRPRAEQAALGIVVRPARPDLWSQAVQAIDGLVMAYGAQARWGLVLFPDNEGDACVQAAPVVPLADNQGLPLTELLGAARDTADPLYPSGPCVTNIFTTLAQVEAMADLRDPERASHVVFITDGAEANCDEGTTNDALDQASQQLLSSMHGEGITTFAVGFGEGLGSRGQQVLERFAVAGGAPQTGGSTGYYQANDAAELSSALGSIVGGVIGCEFSLDGEVTDPSYLRVFLDGERIERDVQGSSGWDYDPQANRVLIQGPDCDRLRSGEAVDVDVVFTCVIQ